MESKRGAAPEPNREKGNNVEEEEEYFLNQNIDAPPPSKGPKWLPMNEDIAAAFTNSHPGYVNHRDGRPLR